VEFGVLVEGDEVGGVACAEDVAAVAAVVFAGEDAEGAAAGGGVACGRGGVGLWWRGGDVSDGWHMLGVEVEVQAGRFRLGRVGLRSCA
jgi:hypothetical protein